MNHTNQISQLERELRKLVTATRKLADIRSKAGLLRRTREEVQDCRVKKYDYQDGIPEYSYVLLDRIRWDGKSLLEFLTEQVPNIPEYPKCVFLVSEIGNVDKDKAKLRIHFLIARIMYNLIDNMPSKDNALLSRFIKDTEGNPAPTSVKARLFGIKLDSNRYDLDKYLVLRRPIASDFEHQNSVHSPNLQNRSLQPPGAYLEFHICRPHGRDPKLLVENYLNLLRLFRAGSVWSDEIEVKSESVEFFNHKRLSHEYHSCLQTLHLQNNDARPLQNFLQRLLPVLPDDLAFGIPKNGISTEALALSRYKDILLQNTLDGGRMASAISSLEALLLLPNERHELSRRLSQRLSCLLGILGWPALSVAEEVRQAYDIRSKHVHGQPLRPGRNGRRTNLLPSITKCAQFMLVIFLQIQKDLHKSALIRLLDDAMLDSSKRQELKCRLDGLTLPPRTAS